MLSKEIIEKIENGEINSRRALYRATSRTRKLLKYLNENKILMPKWWDKGRVTAELINLKKDLGRLPLASDNINLTARAQRYFGSWNLALRDVFGEVNQNTYGELSDQEMLDRIYQYVKKYQRLPLRSDFDGSSMDRPYWEAYSTRFNIDNWSQIFGLVDLSGIKYYTNNKHGFGKVELFNGVVYLSRQELLIGKFLTKKGIRFKKEVPYGGDTGHRFDFYLVDKGVYIEYYGIEKESYLERIETKRSLYGDRRVIEIFKHDNTIDKLAAEVQRL